MARSSTKPYSRKDIKAMKAHGEVRTTPADAPEAVDPAHLEDVLKSLAQARRREFASEADVEAVLRRFEG